MPHRILPALGVFFSLLFPGACQAQNAPARLTGTIALSDQWKPVLYLIQPRQFNEIAANFSGLVVDSAAIDARGNFAFSRPVPPDHAVFYQICVQTKTSRYANQLTDDDPLIANYFPLVLQPGVSVKFTAEADRLQATAAIAQPDAHNARLLRLRDIRHAAFRREQQWLAPGTSHDETQLLDHEAALLRYRRDLMAFADSCADILPALVAARWVSPESDYERVPEFVVGQCKKWTTLQPAHPWAAALCQWSRDGKLPVLVGDTIPNFDLPTAAGDTVPLYQLLGEKITILDIWASWCAPCRRENRTVLAPLYTKYREKGLQVIGYSIDSSPNAWKAAIAKDGAIWPHTSHLTGDATPFMDALRLTTIPANFILDKNGRVLAKNLHGAELERFLVRSYER